MNLKVTISTVGAIIGIAGIEHGVGEVLQGNKSTEGIFIKSWPDSKLYEILNGEPAITILPNYYLAGVLTIIISILFILWIVFYVESINAKYNSLILITFSLGLLLVGGGMAPPIIGTLMSLFIGKIKPHSVTKQEKERTWLHRVWLGSYLFCGGSFLMLWPGLIIIGTAIELTDPIIVLTLIVGAFSSLLVTLVVATTLEKKSFSRLMAN